MGVNYYRVLGFSNSQRLAFLVCSETNTILVCVPFLINYYRGFQLITLKGPDTRLKF